LSKSKQALKLLAVVMTLGVLISSHSLSVYAAPWSEIVSGVELSSYGDGVAEWSNETHRKGDWSIHMAAPGKATWNGDIDAGEGVNEGRIVIKLDPGTTLGDIGSISWWVNTTAGYPPHADLLLDIDGDGVFDGGKKDLVNGTSLEGEDDVLVAEFAYQPYNGSGFEYVAPGVPYGHYDPTLQGSYYNPTYDQWVRTFQNETSESTTTKINNGTVCWLYSGIPGPYNNSYFGTVKDFKEGTVEIINGTEKAPVNASTPVLEIHIEVDNWIGPAEAYLDEITLNGKKVLTELYAPDIDIKRPEHKTYEPGDVPVVIEAADILGVDRVWFNVMDDDGEWLYDKNRTYSGPTEIEDMEEGSYLFHAWANNTLGITGHAQLRFWVRETEFKVEIHPETLNLRSRGKWVTVYLTFPDSESTEDLEIEDIGLEINGVELEPVWGRVFDGVLMLKFSRSELQEAIDEPGVYEIVVSREYADGSSFEGSDTIRAISPGKKGKGPKQNEWGKQYKNQKKFSFKWKLGNNQHSNKNKKGKGGH
jgi:hypothetical protein